MSAQPWGPAAVELAAPTYSRRNPYIRVAGATALPDELIGFDVVTCCTAIEHVAEAMHAGATATHGRQLLAPSTRTARARFGRCSILVAEPACTR